MGALLRLSIAIVVCATFLSVTSSLAKAQETDANAEPGQYGDYDINHSGWNGLSTLASLAQGSGLQVLQRQYIQWEELDSDDVVLLLYPTNFVDPTNVVSFIRNGGRVLIADDFGAGAGLFGRLGGFRSDNINATNYYENKVFAPIAKPASNHPLSDGIASLTTNHPSTIRDLTGMETVFDFGDGSSLVATGSIGAGRYVVLSDPSVLINRMLQFEGNLQFGINLLRFLGRKGKTDRLVVLSGDVAFSGVPRNKFDDGTWRGAASILAAEFDGWLDQLNTWLLTAWGLRMVTVIFSFCLAIGVFLSLPKRRRRPLDGAWTRAHPDDSSYSPAGLLDRYESAGPRTSYLLPAAIQRDNVNAALEQLLETPDPLYALNEQELLALAQRKGNPAVANALKTLLPRLHNLPQRAQAAAHWQPRFLGRSEFDEIHKRSTSLFKNLQIAIKNK